MDAAITALKGVKHFFKSLFSGVSALDELALLAGPAPVRNKFLVVDDIERKHEKLSIDEVPGFIDDFTQNYEYRILLILDTDQLADKNVWEKFREKVREKVTLSQTALIQPGLVLRHFENSFESLPR